MSKVLLDIVSVDEHIDAAYYDSIIDWCSEVMSKLRPHEEGGADPNFFNRDGLLKGLKRSTHEGDYR